MNQYDVIVIGAGNGGLSAAAYLAAAGKKVLVLEKHNLPGGCATSFVRGRFEFEASLHEFCAMGDGEQKGGVRRTLESYGIDVPGVFTKDAFRTICTDPEHSFDAVMPVGAEAFSEAMEEAVPGSYESIHSVMELSRLISDAVHWLSKRGNSPKVYEYPELLMKYGDLLKAEPESVEEICKRFGMSEEARAIYESYWQYTSADPENMSFAIYAIMTYTYLNEVPWVPKERSFALSLAFDEAIRKHGGEIWYNCEVTEIDVRDNRVRGVRLKSGEYLETSYVISNAMPDTVFGKMIRPEEVPSRERKLISARKLGQSATTIYIGLDVSAEELGIPEYNLFVSDTIDGHMQYMRENWIDNHNDYVVTFLNNLIPDASPEGTSMVHFTILYNEDVFRDLKEEDYFAMKDRIARETIEGFEKTMGINIRDHIEELVVALPVTFARYMNTPQGVIYGYEPRLWDGMFPRELSGKKHDHTITGLRFVGGHGTQMDGFSQAIGNGAEQAGYTLEEMEQAK